MPLLDHFHPPLSERRPWESFHTTWAGSIADLLNRELLPPGYIALEQLHGGASVEVDIGAFRDETVSADAGGTATATRTVWTPATAPLVLPAAFPPSASVQVLATEGGQTLVAAIELVSPGNKDRAVKRRLFAAKCAAYLAKGIGLIIVDVVSSWHANLGNELLDLLSLDLGFKMPDEASLYTVGYRPLRQDGVERIDCWPVSLEIGQPLPTMPLSLHADCCLPVDLEAAYTEACQRRRLDEVFE